MKELVGCVRINRGQTIINFCLIMVVFVALSFIVWELGKHKRAIEKIQGQKIEDTIKQLNDWTKGLNK